jgi:hypothetical protein
MTQISDCSPSVDTTAHLEFEFLRDRAHVEKVGGGPDDRVRI